MSSADQSLSISPTTDAGLVARLTIEAWREGVDTRSSGHRFTPADVEALLSEGAVALVAWSAEGTPIGSVIVVPPAPPSAGAPGSTAELTKLAVPARANREQGIGSRLIDAAVEQALAWGAAELLLAVSLYQPRLCRYYARRGFVIDTSRTYGHASPHSPKPIVLVRALIDDHSPAGVARRAADPIGDAARALATGHLVILPTETVYGLGALASDPVAVRRVFATKGRPVDHPLIVHVADRHAMAHWAADVPEAAWRLAEKLWPGPLTLVLRKADWVPLEVTGGLDTVAVRVPRHTDTLRRARPASSPFRYRGTVGQPLRTGQPDHRSRRVQ